MRDAVDRGELVFVGDNVEYGCIGCGYVQTRSRHAVPPPELRYCTSCDNEPSRAPVDPPSSVRAVGEQAIRSLDAFQAGLRGDVLHGPTTSALLAEADDALDRCLREPDPTKCTRLVCRARTLITMARSDLNLRKGR